MIVRALGALAVVASVGFGTPWFTAPAANGNTPTAPTTLATQSIAAVPTEALAPMAFARDVPAPVNPEWSVQTAVQEAFTEVLPDQPMRFALESAQSTRVEGGGRRFDGAGIGTFDGGDARFVAFTMMLSAQGELVEFDYQTHGPGDDADVVAAR